MIPSGLSLDVLYPLRRDICMAVLRINEESSGSLFIEEEVK